MKIKKFEGVNEEDVINLVKAELGLNALILSIKKIQPKGIFSLFKKHTVEVTAAYDDKLQEAVDADTEFEENKAAILKASKERSRDFEKTLKDTTISEQERKIKELESKLFSTSDMLEKAISQLTVKNHSNRDEHRKFQNNLVQIFYDELISQGVLEEIAEDILSDLNIIEENDEIDINLIVKIVYNKIIDILGQPEDLLVGKKTQEKSRVVAFIGSTGVGKTTTIAKLSADFILNKGLDVGLITADTYRIAAVEQLKTYAEILGIEVEVVYNENDLAEYLEVMRVINDIVLIDTAGRSHKNRENLVELGNLLSVVPECEKFLVLSLTTKYEDLFSIVNTYASIADFKIIFTKLDETLKFGSILNICYSTGKKVSYVTMGQNVPDDIETIKPERIARALLGLGDGE